MTYILPAETFKNASCSPYYERLLCIIVVVLMFSGTKLPNVSITEWLQACIQASDADYQISPHMTSCVHTDCGRQSVGSQTATMSGNASHYPPYLNVTSSLTL